MQCLRVRAAWCAACLFLLAGCAPQQGTPPPEFTTELEIDGAQASVSRQLSAGAYLIEAREKDVDLRLVVDAPGVHSEAEDEVPRHGVLHKVVSLHSPAEIRITLRNADHSTKKGSVRVSIARWKRAVDASPDELEQGYSALAAAGEFTAQNFPTSKQDAAEKLDEAVSHFKTGHADAALAQAQYTLANLLYLVLDQYPAAIRAADAAAGAFNRVNDSVGIHDSSTIRAAAEIDLAKGMDASRQRAEQLAMYDDADRRLRDAAEFFQLQELPVRASYAVNMRGIRFLNVGEYEMAGRFFAQALQMARANKDAGTEAMTLANLAWIHNRMGFIALAAAEYETLLPMIEKESEPVQYAAALGNFGFCLIALGDFDRALALHAEALAVYTARDRKSERAIELAALGGLYFQIGDSKRALEILRMAIAAQKLVGDGIGQASSLRVAGNAASTLGRHEEALSYLRESVEIDANQASIARTRVLIARELRAMGDLRGAESEIAKALESSNAMVQANARLERARLRNAQGNAAAAITDMRAADREFLALGIDFNRIDANTELSRALLAARDIAGAAAAADEAVAITGRLRVKSANPEWRARFLSSRYAPYEARIAVDFALGGPEAVWRGFRTAEMVRARSLGDQLALPPKRAAALVDSGGMRAKLTSLQLRLETRTQRVGANDPGTIDLRRAIEETRAQIDANRNGVATNESLLPTSLKEVQKALPSDTAVLAFFVGDFESHAWLLSRDALRHKKLPGLVHIQNAVEATVGLSGATAAGSRATRELGGLLLGGLLEGVTASRLLLIPDGPLQGAPFAALALPGSKAGEQLVDRFVIASAPSLTLALAPHARPALEPVLIAVVADPVYSQNDRRLALADHQVENSVRDAASEFARLTYSAVEARSVIAAFEGRSVIELTGFEATVARVLALPVDRLGILHFATHAVARNEFSGGSALFLTKYSAKGAPLAPDRLTLDDIARSSLRANLVVLSGCSTGAGDELRGEGVLGLAYAFLANGSGAVVASLQPVEDAPTARLMEQFYAAYRTSGNAADALRVAQLRTRQIPGSSVWSSFVVRTSGFP